ncbi:MAG: hypothetical protein KDD70_01470 [Bdellovibrionales bacterium]|nr:hypothetical protein [Bdellovibrionales bacterium]
MAFLLFLLVVVISFVVVRIGALALELTGVPWEQAKFQALSAFSNTGFATRDFEAHARHPIRRRILSFLIVLGNAGLITLTGAFVGSLLQDSPFDAAFDVFLVALIVVCLVWVSHYPPIASRLRLWTEHFLEKRYNLKPSNPREMLRLDEGYALVRITLTRKTKGVNKSLRELQLMQNTVQILAIERGERFIPVPRGDVALEVGDSLVVYGNEESIQFVFQGEEENVIEVQ